MQIVIDIPEEIYNDVMTDGVLYIQYEGEIGRAIRSSTPLEKVFEDIKAEIEEQITPKESGKSMIQNCGLSMALEIIDKHISGKENE